jgi:hypothetical protein
MTLSLFLTHCRAIGADPVQVFGELVKEVDPLLLRR